MAACSGLKLTLKLNTARGQLLECSMRNRESCALQFYMWDSCVLRVFECCCPEANRSAHIAIRLNTKSSAYNDTEVMRSYRCSGLGSPERWR